MSHIINVAWSNQAGFVLEEHLLDIVSSWLKCNKFEINVYLAIWFLINAVWFSVECPFGHFGRACKEICNEHCLQENNTLCDHVGGKCLNGCEDGYIGTYCNNCKKIESLTKLVDLPRMSPLQTNVKTFSLSDFILFMYQSSLWRRILWYQLFF